MPSIAMPVFQANGTYSPILAKNGWKVFFIPPQANSITSHNIDNCWFIFIPEKSRIVWITIEDSVTQLLDLSAGIWTRIEILL